MLHKRYAFGYLLPTNERIGFDGFRLDFRRTVNCCQSSLLARSVYVHNVPIRPLDFNSILARNPIAAATYRATTELANRGEQSAK